jgi:8-oxo-dGTP pyrophosphatase MutT (NUDIX family)
MEKMEKEQNNMEKEKVYRGAIAIFYKKIEGEPRFLVVQNTETGNISFVSGAEEDVDSGSLKASAQREIEEELGLKSVEYKLIPTETRHEFIFGEKKKERAGHKGSYHVFLSDLSGLNEEVGHTGELKSVKWMTEEEVLNTLTFDDLKEVFKDATKNIV